MIPGITAEGDALYRFRGGQCYIFYIIADKRQRTSVVPAAAAYTAAYIAAYIQLGCSILAGASGCCKK